MLVSSVERRVVERIGSQRNVVVVAERCVEQADEEAESGVPRSVGVGGGGEREERRGKRK